MPPRKSRRRKKAVSVSPAVKISGVLAVMAIVGLGVAGLKQYGAIAAEVRQNLGLTALADSVAQVALPPHEEPRDYRFSMALVGGRVNIPELARYQRVEVEMVAKGSRSSVSLLLQKAGRNQPLQTFERVVSADYFTQVWQALRDEEISQLTNLSPHTEDLGEWESRLSTFKASAATYSVYFKDGVYDYPNSFEVHAPEHLKDVRYQSVRDLGLQVIKQRFGDVISR